VPVIAAAVIAKNICLNTATDAGIAVSIVEFVILNVLIANERMYSTDQP